MIDRKELKDLAILTQNVILRRIGKLTDIAELLDVIQVAVFEEKDDIYLEHLMVSYADYRELLEKHEEEWAVEEKALWDKMIHIND